MQYSIELQPTATKVYVNEMWIHVNSEWKTDQKP